MLASSFFRAADRSITSGRFRRCCWYQNMKAQCAVRLTEQTRIVRMAVRRTSPRNRSAMPGRGVRRLAAWPRAIPRSRGPRGGSRTRAGPAARRPGRPRAGCWPASTKRRARGQQDADVDAGLEHGGDPGPPAARPGLRQQRGADRPLAADAQRGQESDDQQLPPRLREEGQAGEERVGEDRQAERAAAADPVADAAEEAAAERPADQERRLDPRAVPADDLVPRVGHADQLGDERGRDQDVEVHVQAVEQPAEPGGDPRLPLVRREVAQAPDLVARRLRPIRLLT